MHPTVTNLKQNKAGTVGAVQKNPEHQAGVSCRCHFDLPPQGNPHRPLKYCRQPPPAAGPASSPGEPHAALLLTLGYMRLRELLACARACRGLREAVAGDPLLWLRLVVEPPLSHRITDEALLALTDRAQGRLRSLHLLGCPRVSDAGLLRIVERNPDVTEVL